VDSAEMRLSFRDNPNSQPDNPELLVSVPNLKQAIDELMQAWNDKPRPFIWTATASHIIEKIERARLKMERIKPGSTRPRGKKTATNA
jgi:hypothetical protein